MNPNDNSHTCLWGKIAAVGYAHGLREGVWCSPTVPSNTNIWMSLAPDPRIVPALLAATPPNSIDPPPLSWCIPLSRLSCPGLAPEANPRSDFIRK